MIASRLPQLWEDLEQVSQREKSSWSSSHDLFKFKATDGVLQQYDRKTIKNFLKRDVDGNPKSGGNLINKYKEVIKYLY